MMTATRAFGGQRTGPILALTPAQLAAIRDSRITASVLVRLTPSQANLLGLVEPRDLTLTETQVAAIQADISIEIVQLTPEQLISVQAKIIARTSRLTEEQLRLFLRNRMSYKLLPDIKRAGYRQMRAAYEARVRQLVVELYSRDPGVLTLGNRDIQDRIMREAVRFSRAVVSGHNRYLAQAIANGEVTDDAGYQAWKLNHVEPYNRDQLIPRQLDWADSQATLDFLSANSEGALVNCEPDDAVCPVCQDAVSMGDTSPDEASDIPLPAHPQCEHRWAPVGYGQLADYSQLDLFT